MGIGQNRDAQRLFILALVESNLQRLSLLFCFLCCEFPRNQIEPYSNKYKNVNKALIHDFLD